MRCADCVSERPLTFASPHHTIYWIAANIIFSKSLPKCLHFGIVEAERICFLTGQRDLLQTVNALQVTAKHIFIPAESFHAPGLSAWENLHENVETRMIGCLNLP